MPGCLSGAGQPGRFRFGESRLRGELGCSALLTASRFGPGACRQAAFDRVTDRGADNRGFFTVRGGNGLVDPAQRSRPIARASAHRWCFAISRGCRTTRLHSSSPFPRERSDDRRTAVNFFSRILEVKTDVDGIATFDWLPLNNDDLMFLPISEEYANRRVIVEDGEYRSGHRHGDMNGEDSWPGRRPRWCTRCLHRDPRLGTGQGMDHGQAEARTAADGSYEMSVNSGEAYAVYVDDKDWAARSRLDVVVREGKLVDGVDFRLSGAP